MFLPNTSSGSHDFASLFPTDIVNVPQSPILLQDTDSEGNLCNITQMNPIDISAKPDVIEHVHVWKNCSANESEAFKALFKEFVIFLPGPMRRCRGLTLPLWSMRLKLIARLNLSGKNLGKSILGRPQLLKLRLRNF